MPTINDTASFQRARIERPGNVTRWDDDARLHLDHVDVQLHALRCSRYEGGRPDASVHLDPSVLDLPYPLDSEAVIAEHLVAVVIAIVAVDRPGGDGKTADGPEGTGPRASAQPP